MESTGDAHGRGGEAPLPARSRLVASLPLLVVSGGLFATAALVLDLAPHARPDGFPLWGFLLTLGAIAALGATFLWFSASAPPTAPVSGGLDASPDPAFGRPLPEVRPRPRPPPVAASWDESALPVRRAAPPPRPVVVRARAPDDVERALAEIAEIEEQLEVRPLARSAAAGARA